MGAVKMGLTLSQEEYVKQYNSTPVNFGLRDILDAPVVQSGREALEMMARGVQIVRLPDMMLGEIYNRPGPFIADAWTLPSESVIHTQRGSLTVTPNVVWRISALVPYTYPSHESDNTVVTPFLLCNTLRKLNHNPFAINF